MAESFTSPSWGQAKPPSRYDVFDIGDIPAQSGWHSFSYTAFAINENNSVVGWADMRIAGSQIHHQHAVFWTPDAKHGFAAFTLDDLTDLAGLSPVDCPDGKCSGFGYDINNADVVVGSQKLEWGLRDRGFVWDLPTNDYTGGLQTFAIESLLASPTEGDCVLHGISDASPAVMVGAADDEYPGGLLCGATPVAVRATFSGVPSALTRLDAVVGGSAALDISEASTARAVGQAEEGCGPLGGCSVADDAQRWIVGGAIEALDEGGFDDTISRAVNNAAQACGDSGEITENACPPQALFWDGDGTLTVIGDPSVVPQLPPDPFTQAWGISPASGQAVNVVGAEATSERALLWHRDSFGVWTGYDLSVRMTPGCPLDVLTVAHDINSQGWVVGSGLDCLGRVRGFVLRPAVCPADLDGDCQIAASDIAILLGWWGAPGLNGSGAYADLDQDGLVAASDLAVLLGAWGACSEDCLACSSPCAPAGSAGFSEQGAMAGSNDSTSPQEMLSTALAVLGFESVQQFNEWSESASPTAVTAATEAMAQVCLSALHEGGES